MPLSDTDLTIGSKHLIVENLPSEARILRTEKHAVVGNLIGGQAGKLLYEAVAWFVLPALANGCLTLRKWMNDWLTADAKPCCRAS